MNLPDLHLRHPRNARDDWRKWILELKEGTSLYPSALASWPSSEGERPERLKIMVKHLVPEGRDGIERVVSGLGV
jgi:hypothetical protein